MRQHDRSSSENIFWPVVWAVGLHAVLFAFLFVSFARTPDLPPARPVIKLRCINCSHKVRPLRKPIKRLLVKRRKPQRHAMKLNS